MTCNYVQSCIADALTSGLVRFGTNTGSQLQKNTEADAKLSVTPPLIEFNNSFIQIDWSDLKLLEITANVISYGNNNDIATIIYNFTNAASYNVTRSIISGSLSLVTIIYMPSVGEYPIFE